MNLKKLLKPFRGHLTRILRLRYAFRLAHLGQGTIIHRRASIEGFLYRVRIGSHVWIRRDTLIECDQPTSEIEIGNNCLIGPSATLLVSQGRITIGNNCSINPYCILYGQGGLTIGNWVRMGAQTVIVTSNHVFEDPTIPIKKQGLTKIGVVIEDDVWIGAGVRILDGVRIGHGSVIGAGAVVTHDIPSFSIAVGVPARVVGIRGGGPGVETELNFDAYSEPATSRH